MPNSNPPSKNYDNHCLSSVYLIFEVLHRGVLPPILQLVVSVSLSVFLFSVLLRPSSEQCFSWKVRQHNADQHKDKSKRRGSHLVPGRIPWMRQSARYLSCLPCSSLSSLLVQLSTGYKHSYQENTGLFVWGVGVPLLSQHISLQDTPKSQSELMRSLYWLVAYFGENVISQHERKGRGRKPWQTPME